MTLVPIVCNQLAALAFGVLGVTLVSKFIPPDVNGSYILFVTLTQIGFMVTHSGLVNHATRYWQREHSRAGTYTRFLWNQSWKRLSRLSVLLLVISIAVSVRYQDLTWLWLYPYLIVCNIATALGMTATGVLNADRSPWKVLVLSGVSSATRILLPIGVGLLFAVTSFTLSIGYTLHAVVLIGALLLLFWWASAAPAPGEELTAKWMQELRDYGRPFVWMGVGSWLLQSADRWIVSQFFDNTQTGLFAYATGIGSMIPLLVVGGLMQWVFPTIFRQADTAKTVRDWRQIARKCDQVTALFLGLTIGGLFLFLAVSGYLVGPVISEKYVPSLGMVLPAGFAMATLQVNQFYFLLMQGQHDSAGMVKVMMIIALAKTLGSIVAASISWPAFQGWLVASLFLAALAGRIMIRRIALGRVETHHAELAKGEAKA